MAHTLNRSNRAKDQWMSHKTLKLGTATIFLYACESCTLTAEFHRRIQAMEMRCYRKIPRISYKDHVSNEKVRAKIRQAIGPHEDLLTIVWPKPICKAQ